ncbi:MAG: hypothetical protein E7319_02180 [Clostridiales bacterium]|nr:hypothetical protein [Clostridiales bacterium]
MAKNIRLPEKKKTTDRDKLAQAVAAVAARKAEAQAAAKRTISRKQADTRSPASVNRENYLRSQGIDPVRERQEQRAQARRDAARMLMGAAVRETSEAASRIAQRPDGGRHAFANMGATTEREMPHQMARTAAPTDQMRQRLVADVNATGRLPAGYGWYGTGENAVAADQRGLVYKPLEGVTAGSRAATPAVYGINPDSYLTYMHDYDAWEAERDNLPEAAKRAQEYLQPAIDAESDPVRKADLQEQLDTAMANAQYSPTEQRRRKQLEDKATAATEALGEDIGQYAGRSDADYLRSYGQQYGIGQEGEAYGESYHAPLFQRKGSDAAEHADLMNKLRFREQYGAINPVDMLETGDTQMLQNLTDEDAAVYMGMAARYGADTAQDYWNAMRQEGQYGQKAYAVRDKALRDMAGNGFWGGAGSSALSVLTSPMSLAGTLYSVTQKLTGEEIDPYADQFMFGQMTGTLRDEVGQNITRHYGKEDGTDTFASWLMKTGYNAAMSSADSLVAGRLSGGSALGGSLLLGSSGAGSVIQDAKLRGATDEQALALGGLSIAFETATEYLPMDTLLDTIEGKDVRTFRDVLGSALKGGLSEAPGEGLSELLSHVSDQALMGPMSNYNLNVAQYQQTGMSSEEAHAQAKKDLMWDVFNAAATGFLSGEGSNLLAGSNALIYNRNSSGLQTADQQLQMQPMVDPLAAAADALATKQTEQKAAAQAVPVAQEDADGVSRFDRPMAAAMIDAENGSGNVQVIGFETTQDGKNVVLHTVDEAGNRGTAMAGELAFADETVQELMTADGAKNLSGEGLQSYLTGYTETVNGKSVAPSEYAQAYGMVYRRAAAGMDMAEVIRGSVIPQVMTQSAMQDAYAAGLGAGAHQQATTPLSSTKGTMNRSFTKGAWNRMTRQEQRVAAANMEVVSQLAKRMGATINIVDSIATADGQRANGQYNPQTGQIDIALDADAKAYAYVAMHELTHQLKAEHETSWSTFSGWVQEALTDKGQDFEKLVKYQMDSFGLSREDAAEEVICNTVPAMLQDEGTLQKLYEQDRTLFEKLMDWLKNLISDVKAAGKALSERSESWRQMGALKEDAATLQGLYDVMESIMQSEGEAASGNSGTKSSPKTASFAEHKLFSGLVDKLRQLNPDSYITVGTIEKGSPLEQVGIPNGKLYFDVSKALKELDKHGDHLSEKVYKEIPSLLANPIVITQYKNNTVSVYGHLIHNGTTPIVVGVMIAKDRSGTASIAKIRTVHARGDYWRQITDDSVLYLNPNKKETSAWFQARGIHVPLGGKRFGFIRSIAGDTQNVKHSRSDFDAAYSSAVEQGNMDKIADLVAQAAEESMPDSKLRTPNGKLRVVYHGTNSEDFTVFDPQYIGMSSGDTGFFGRGFYFAYSKGEASFYGRKRIIPAYLNLTNPFNFQENLHEYNGERTFDYNASSAVALMNFADKFPKIAEKITIDVARKGESFKEIPIREFADEYKKVLSDTEFLYDEVDGEFGDKETVVLADPEIHEFDYGGEKHTFKDYGFQKRVAGKVDKLSISYDYLASRVYSSVDMPNFTRVLLDHNKEFTATLKEMGYDGVMQSEDGDEAVAFESSQIKSAEPVTYDDAGNVIPLSKRFQDDNTDIRYSMSDYDDTVREGENVLEELLTMTAAHRMTDAEAARVARRVLKAASSEMDLDEATQRIKSIFDYASRSGNKLDMQGLSSEATALAEDMLSQSKTLDMQHEEEVADLRYYLKHNQIALSTEQQKEAASLMGGSYGAYRQALFGRVNLRNSGSALDGAVWEQLHETAPHLFPLDATSGDQVRLLMEAAEYVQPVYHNESGLDAREAAQWLTHELFKGYMNLSGVQSAAKEQNRLGLKLHQYRQVAERFAKEHKAAFDEAYAKVTKDANVRIAMAADKAERRADKAISEAAADADLRVAKAQAGVDKRIADAKQQNLADMEAYREAMREKARAWRSEFVTRHRDVERKNRYRAQILRETNQLLKKVEKPTDKQHVQDELTGALTAFLKSLDLGKRSRERSIGDRILRLRNMMQDAANGESTRSFIVDSDMLETMRFMAEQLQDMNSLDQLTADQMEQVRNIVHCAVWTVNKADTAFANQKAIRISSSAGRFLQEAGERKDWKDRGKIVNGARDFLTVGQMDSMHFFDKLGGAAKEMYQSLRNGLDKKTMHRAAAMAYVEEAVSKIPAKVQKELFAGKKAKATAYDLSGGTVELTKGQVMEIYCLNKREQARGHLYDESVGGIRVGDNDKARAVKVNEGDIEKLTDTLTSEEKALADALQQYMANECAQWGNETSLQLYGYKKFGEKNYYPIRVDPDSVDSNISSEGQQDNLYAIANMGMTKALKEKAKNALYIGDIFDTFCRHVDNMATYNAYAAPIADLVRWYNYRPGDGSSVKKMIQAKWGKEAAEYIPQLIRDLNGEVNRSYSPKWTEKLTGVMKSSSVGRNVRVVIQQPTAILRAGDMIDYRFLVRGMSGLTGKGGRVKLKKAIELSKQHCPIALLKSMGFFETDMGKSLRAALFDNRSVGDKVKDEGMWLAGKMDEMTFGAIWRACEAETRKLKPELTVGSEAYYEAVGNRMSGIIDYTQVVDTPFHRTQLMRSGDGLTKMATSFMSEPSKTYNMLASAMQRLKENRHDPVAKRKFCRTISAYALNTIVNAAAQSLIDAVRNGDDEDFWEKWGKAMFGDWSS